MKVEINQIHASAHSAIYNCYVSLYQERRFYLSESILSKICAQIMSTFIENSLSDRLHIQHFEALFLGKISSSDIITADVVHYPEHPLELNCHLHVNGKLTYSAFSKVA